MIDLAAPGGVKDLAVSVLKTRHDKEHVESLVEEPRKQDGSVLVATVFEPMAPNEVQDPFL